MTNVLIPTDFSEYSLNAIRYAMEYLREESVNFFILHVIPDDQLNGFSGNTPFEDQVLGKLIAEGIVFNKDHRFFPVKETASLVESVRKQVDDKKIDLIVMGTKGITRSPEGSVSSHTYEVITKVKCPILVVPEHAVFNEQSNISFVTDYNCIYRNEVLDTLSKTLKLHNSSLRVLKPRVKNRPLTAGQIDNKGFIHYFFRDRDHSFHFLEKENLEEGIQDFVDTYKIKMVAIPARNLNFIQKLMLRFSSEKINYHTVVPFLVIHE